MRRISAALSVVLACAISLSPAFAATVDPSILHATPISGIADSGSKATPRLHDTGDNSHLYPIDVRTVDSSGNYVAPGSGGSGGGNTVAPTAAGTSATTANPVQGVTGGVPLPVSGTVNITAATPIPVSGTFVAPSPIPVVPTVGASPFPIVAATPLPVMQNKRSFVMTTTSLGANAVYTSPWYDTLTDGSQTVSVQLYATGTSGTLPNYQIQQTDDTGNGNLIISSNYLASLNFYSQVSSPINHRYWRVVYTNGNTAQTAFEMTATLTNNPSAINLQDPNSGYTATISNPNNDNESQNDQALLTENFNMNWNPGAGSWQRQYSDPFTGGPSWHTDGGSGTTAIAAATTGPTIVKASAGRLAHVTITAAGTTGNVTIYNNATACSGAILAVIPGTSNAATNGQLGTDFDFQKYASNGIAVCGAAASAGISVTYF
jgi:hypothetical protein